MPSFRKPAPVYREFRAGDVRFSRADISRAQTLLGFKPAVRAQQGLERALEWYVARLGPARSARGEAALQADTAD